jgi:Cu/Ag efflux protein CusF
MKTMNSKKIPLVLAALLALPALARAQKPISQANVEELTAKIEAIDHDNRLVTLKDKDGDVDTIYAGPEVKRFDELKVGDTVTFRYYESLVYRIRKPGEPASAPGSESPTIVRSQGPRPGGTASQQQTVTVTVKAIDPKVPSVTVVTESGRTSSHKVEDKKNIEGLKVGDKVEITYTEAIMISVK